MTPGRAAKLRNGDARNTTRVLAGQESIGEQRSICRYLIFVF
jgi:hypothetical protein